MSDPTGSEAGSSLGTSRLRPPFGGRPAEGDFIHDDRIEDLLEQARDPERVLVRDILDRSLALQRLEPEQTAALLQVEDPDLWEEIFQAAAAVKERVYGPRVVTFAPLYCGSYCTNSCVYCGFRRENVDRHRRVLSEDEIRQEVEALLAVGHKRLVLVYGEHPRTAIDYIERSIAAVYGAGGPRERIRRVNINAAPLSVDHCRRLREAGIGTYQVFQETYHHETYRRVHPRGPKADYRRRLLALHRAQEAGIDDVAIGALFGLYHWRFEVMGLLLHAIDLERCFGGIGPHTLSFPRIEPAAGAPLTEMENPYRVSDRDFKRLVAVLRLSVPYTGMIVTAREPAAVRREALLVGCTQADASSRIGIGAYGQERREQQPLEQQFLLGDMRSLEELVRELAELGLITSFCTAGYRCGRTGSTFMQLARQGKVREFCLPNALLTFQEYLLDHASPQTRSVGEALIASRLAEIPAALQPRLRSWLQAIEAGERDLRM